MTALNTATNDIQKNINQKKPCNSTLVVALDLTAAFATVITTSYYKTYSTNHYQIDHYQIAQKYRSLHTYRADFLTWKVKTKNQSRENSDRVSPK